LKLSLTVVLVLFLTACFTTQPAPNNSGTQPGQGKRASQPAKQPASEPSALREGEASGTIIDEGQTVPIKYAYAGRGEQFGEEAIVLLLTDRPIPPEALIKGMANPSELFSDVIRGLEYKVGKRFWVMFHPSHFQTSGINTPKDYSVADGVVKGHDEDATDFSGKEYKRSVRFVARLPKKP
jgi:hypothetical protein